MHMPENEVQGKFMIKNNLTMPGWAAAALTMAVFLSFPAYGDICKWVDDEGVTHFANECPDGVEASSVAVDESPTAEQLADAENRSKQLYNNRTANRDSSEQEDAEQSRERQQSKRDASRRTSECRKSIRELGILSMQRPIFYDGNGRLHHDREGFAYTYNGPRRYVEDKERAQLIEHWSTVQAENCGN
jgi:hypothetical protein